MYPLWRVRRGTERVSKDTGKPDVGKTTKLPDGRDMTLVDYTEDEDGDSFTWIVE